MAAQINPAPAEERDYEKQINPENQVNDYPDKESDSEDSGIKQDGVKAVEAVTQIWSPAMMWAVFGL